MEGERATGGIETRALACTKTRVTLPNANLFYIFRHYFTWTRYIGLLFVKLIKELAVIKGSGHRSHEIESSLCICQERTTYAK